MLPAGLSISLSQRYCRKPTAPEPRTSILLNEVSSNSPTRERAGLFDETSFSKIEVRGSGAVGFLQYLCDNDIDKPAGSIVYTSMLNPRGGIECDFTITRLEIDRFLIITGTAFGQHDISWLRINLPESVSVADVTSNLACIGLWGPLAG